MTDPEEIRRLLDEGLTHYGLGNVEQALAVWRRVLLLDPANGRAKEYIRFVQENWAPGQTEQNSSYRPDEGSDGQGRIGAGSGGIAAPGTEPTLESPPVAAILSPEAPLPQPAPAIQEAGGFGQVAPASGPGVFTPPARPILESAQWGDLYEFGRTAAPKPVRPEPAAPPAPAPSRPPSDPFLPPPPPPVPWPDEIGSSPQVAPDRILSSTLPPHPAGEAPVAPAGEVSGLPPAPPDLPITKRYDAVPTAIRQQENIWIPDAEAVPPPPPPVGPALFQSPVPAELKPAAPTLKQPVPASRPAPEPVRLSPTPPFIAPSAPSRASASPPSHAGSALDLVANQAPAPTPSPAAALPTALEGVDAWIRGARDLLELDDFSGALELLDKVAAEDPGHQLGQKMRQEAEQGLVGIFSSKLGDLGHIPRVRMSGDEIIWLNLDNRAGFVLSLVDGRLSYDEILSVCGLPEVEGMRILVLLVQDKVIEAG